MKMVDICVYNIGDIEIPVPNIIHSSKCISYFNLYKKYVEFEKPVSIYDSDLKILETVKDNINPFKDGYIISIDNRKYLKIKNGWEIIENKLL